jgi:hypothetical protein
MGMIDAKDGRRPLPQWTALEEWTRLQVRDFVQELLKAEVTELLGRERSERMAAVDGERGYRNSFGKPRRLTMSCGTITLRRPRVRGLEERFESRILPLFKRRTEAGENTRHEILPSEARRVMVWTSERTTSLARRTGGFGFTRDPTVSVSRSTPRSQLRMVFAQTRKTFAVWGALQRGGSGSRGFGSAGPE